MLLVKAAGTPGAVAALSGAAGGSASLWGWSSGGALALRAAGAGIGVERLSVADAADADLECALALGEFFGGETDIAGDEVTPGTT